MTFIYNIEIFVYLTTNVFTVHVNSVVVKNVCYIFQINICYKTLDIICVIIIIITLGCDVLILSMISSAACS